MRKLIAFSSAITLALPAAPALAQDYSMPYEWSRGMPMEAAIRAQAKEQERANKGRADKGPRVASKVPRTEAQAYVSNRRICTRELPTFRARLGAGDSRVRKMTSLCRQAGHL